MARYIMESHYGEEMPVDNITITKWYNVAHRGKRAKDAGYEMKHFYSAIAIHSTFKSLTFRKSLRQKVQEFEKELI